MDTFRTLLNISVIGVTVLFSITPAGAQATSYKKKHLQMPTESALVNPNRSVELGLSTPDEPELRQGSPLPFLNVRLPKIVDAVQAELPGIEVGFTYYDFQTNGSMANRLVYTPDGPDKYVQMVWMTSKDSTRDITTRIPGFAGNARGTHYTFIDVSNPDQPALGIENWDKVEAQRAGWPSLVQYQDGLVGTPSHTPIRWYGNSGVGDQPILYKDVTPPADSSLWPRAAVDGKGNTHLIYNRTVPGSGNQVGYRRSTDGGFTWSSETLFTGPTSIGGNLPVGLGGDTYAVTARGDNVVVVYTDNSLRMLAWRSTDGGSTWPTTLARVVFAPNYTDIDSAYNNFGTFEVFSDTVPTPNGHMDVILDSDGTAHYVVGWVPSYVIRRDTNGARTGTIYVLNDRASLINGSLLYGNDISNTLTFMGRSAESQWDGTGYVMNLRFFDGLTRWPQLGIDANNSIYCTYGYIKNGDVLTMLADTTGGNQMNEPDTLSTVDALHGHVWATYKVAGSDIWSPPTNLTPDGVNCQYASLCDDVVNRRMYIGYSAATQPGDRVTNLETSALPARVMMLAYDVAQLTPVNSVEEQISNGLHAEIMPNPARESATMRILSVTPGNITVSVVSSIGEVLSKSDGYSSNGDWELLIPTGNLNPGVYHCIIEHSGTRAVRSLVVVR